MSRFLQYRDLEVNADHVCYLHVERSYSSVGEGGRVALKASMLNGADLVLATCSYGPSRGGTDNWTREAHEAESIINRRRAAVALQLEAATYTSWCVECGSTRRTEPDECDDSHPIHLDHCKILRAEQTAAVR